LYSENKDKEGIEVARKERQLLKVLGLVLPLESIKLGRLVTNPEEPHQDYWDPTSDQTPEKIIKRPQLRFLDMQNDAAGSGLVSRPLLAPQRKRN
jgi:hypothetical protein